MFRSQSEEGYIELEDVNSIYQRKRKSAQAAQATAAVVAVDGLNLSTIYLSFLVPALKSFIEELGKFIFFPIAATAAVIETILSWRQAQLSKWETSSVIGAVVTTVTAAGIVAAVVGSLVASTLFAVATPAIFTAVAGTRTLYNTGAAIYNGVKAATTDDPEKKSEYRQKAIQHGAAAFAGALATVAAATVFLAGKFTMAILGVVTGVVIAGLGIFSGIRAYMAKRKAKEAMQQQQVEEGHDHAPQKKRGSVLDITKKLAQGNNVEDTLKKRTSEVEEIQTPAIPVKKQDESERQPLLLDSEPTAINTASTDLISTGTNLSYQGASYSH